MKALLILALSALVSGVVELWPFLQERPLARDPLAVEARVERPGSPCVGHRECERRKRESAASEAQEPSGSASAELRGGSRDAFLPGGLWLHARTAVDL
jgi:hypothetical protein